MILLNYLKQRKCQERLCNLANQRNKMSSWRISKKRNYTQNLKMHLLKRLKYKRQ